MRREGWQIPTGSTTTPARHWAAGELRTFALDPVGWHAPVDRLQSMHAPDMVDLPRDLTVARAVGAANQDIKRAHAVGDELPLKLASLTQTCECLGQCADGDG